MDLYKSDVSFRTFANVAPALEDIPTRIPVRVAHYARIPVLLPL